MTDFVELLNSMSSTFNSDCATSTAEGGSLLNLDLAEDKTVKWRNLANNQFACKDKEKKQSQQQTEKQQEAATETDNEQQKLLDADVKLEATTPAAAAEAAVATAAETALPTQGQSQSQSADAAVDAGAGADAVTAEITDAAVTQNATATEAAMETAATSTATTEGTAEIVTGKTTQTEAADAVAAAETTTTVIAVAASTSASTPNETATTAAAAADNENDGDDECKSEGEVEKGDGGASADPTTTTIEKELKGEEAAAAAATEEEEETTTATTTAAVKLEQETTTTAVDVQATPTAQISAAAAATETTTTTMKEVTTTTTKTTAEGIKTETEIEMENAPKEEFLEEQQQQKEEEQQQQKEEDQQQQNGKEQQQQNKEDKQQQQPLQETEKQIQLTAPQFESNADASAAEAAAKAAAETAAETAGAAAVAESAEVVISSTGEAATDAASPTLLLPTTTSASLLAVVASPLVVNAVDVASGGGAADATVSTSMSAVAAVSDGVVEATTTTTTVIAADKNEQNAAGSTRRLRRTPRPTDTPTPTTTTPTPTTTPTTTTTTTTPVSIDSEQDQQQTESPITEPPPTLPTECSEDTDIKKESEKCTTDAAAAAVAAANTPPPAAAAAAAPKRGRGRGKKLKPDAADAATVEALTESTSTVSTQTAAVAADEATTSTSSTPTPPLLERKAAGRGKRKLPEEEQQQQQQLGDLSSLIVKTEQDENVVAAPSGDGKRMRRSVRLGNRQDLSAAAYNWSSNSAEELIKTEPLSTTTTTTASVELLAGHALLDPMLSLLDDKTPPKKRGRKAKTPSAALQQTLPHAATTTATTAMATATATATVAALPNGNKRAGGGEQQQQPVPKRSKRRIKPTTKILENDELRCEFETKHIERMTHWEATATAAEAGEAGCQFETPPLQQTFSAGGGSNSSRQKSDKSDGGGSGGGGGGEHHPAGTSAIKKRLFSKSQRDIDNSGAALLALSLQRPCPDLEQFINDIKAAKLNANRSPEERKLNKKQQRKLAKQKEKHFKHLGLRRRNNSEQATDNDSSNTDNEEFVPTTRVQVGKPSVTLRQRNAGKEARQSQPQNATLPAAAPATSKLTRRVQAAGAAAGVRGVPGVPVAAVTPSTTLQQSQLHSLNSAILASNTRDGLLVVPSTSSSAAAAAPVKFICFCQKGSQYYARNAPDASFCCAIDNIDEQKIGCCNELSAEVHNLLRPSQRVGYMILCDEHKKRLQAHNCCAGCGIFCTQGKFVLCKQQHFFHPDCAQRFILNSPYDDADQQQQQQQPPLAAGGGPMLVLKCPHCGLDTPERTSTVTMKCQTLPVFLPAQKSKIKPAKLTTSAHLAQFANAAGNSKKCTSNTNTTKANSGGAAGAARGAKSNGTRGKATPSCSTNGNGSALNVINFEQLIPESVMNVVLRGRMVSSSGRVTTEFNSRDMFYAVQNDDLERVAEILAADYNVVTRMREFLNGTCLHLVAHSGTLQMAYLLLCKGASSQNFVNIVDSELKTALMCAVMNEKCDMLNLFLQCGADVAIKGPDGMTCLHIAAKQGILEAAQLIVDSYRASRNIASFLSFVNAQDEGGWTAMVWAAELGHTDIVSLLINNDADPNICDNDNNTVLHWSTLHNDGLETITVLLQAGADCNVQNVEGDTPLHIACRHSVTRMCIALIANGADLMIKNRAEQLPFDCIPNEESECGRTVGFNMQMRSFRPLGLRTRVVCADASNGRELRPIQAVRNELTMTEHEDEADALMWPDFKYISSCIILQNSVQIDRRVSQMRICSCQDSCSSDLCQCNGASSQNWYTAESRLNCEFNYDDPAVIFECNDVCGCNQLSCKNRVVQNGTRTPLQIVECEDQAKGWGVRALANVPKGTFVSSYTGEILTAPEADRRTDDSYYFDLDNGHCIDANYYGNVSRFFNHSCEPNILPVRVFYEHQDYRFPKIAFFACRDIDAGEEICYDYGDKFWRGDHRANGGGCKCLTASCKYAKYSGSSNASPTEGTAAAAADEDPLASSTTDAGAGAAATQLLFNACI